MYTFAAPAPNFGLEAAQALPNPRNRGCDISRPVEGENSTSGPQPYQPYEAELPIYA